MVSMYIVLFPERESLAALLLGLLILYYEVFVNRER